MKKLFLLLLLSFITITIANSQIKMMMNSEAEEFEKINLLKNNNFKKISIYKFEIDEVEWQQDSMLFVQREYDAAGNTYTEINYSPSFSKTIVKYSSSNKISSRENYDNAQKLTGKNIYFYNDDGKLIKREMYFGLDKAFDEVFEYDNQGYITTLKYLLNDGTIFNYSTFTTDNSGNITEEIKYNSKGDIEYKYEYTYGNNSLCNEERIILPDNSIQKINYTYDKGGYITEKITKDDKEKIISSYKVLRDKSGNKTEEYFENPTSKISNTFEYKKGLLKSVKSVELPDVSSYLLRYYYE